MLEASASVAIVALAIGEREFLRTARLQLTAFSRVPEKPRRFRAAMIAFR